MKTTSSFEKLNSQKNRPELSKEFNEWLEKDIREQYDRKRKTLNNLGLLEILNKEGEIGITGIDGERYPFPDLEEIQKAIRENQNILGKKRQQGFSELEIVPFALPLSRLLDALKKQLIVHHREGKLFGSGASESSPLPPFDLKEESPLSFSENYDNSDLNKDLVYYPKNFSNNHQGKTKEEILQKLKQGHFPGYLVILREHEMNIQKNRDTSEVGGRQSLGTPELPASVLEKIKNEPIYEGESGQTLEEWITEFITYLEENNKVIDDFQRGEAISCQIGTYFPSFEVIPRCASVSSHKHIVLATFHPDSSLVSAGVRTSVIINRFDLSS